MTVGLGVGLFERERELEQLDAALSAVLAGVGQVVVVQGSPGIGKSRLVDALCARAEGSARVLRGRGGELERELPLAVVRELFEPVVGRADDAERSRLLAGAAGLAGPLLGVGVGESGAVESAFAVMHGLYWLTANLADDGPLVLAVDDAHWTDEATQRWLAYLVPRISELPVLLALALRPRELDPSSRLASALAVCVEATLVEPGELGIEGTCTLVAHALGEPDEEFCVAVHRATGGNPLLVRTLAGALAANGIAPSASTVDQVHSVGIGRIGRIVLPRMHRLGRDAVAFARAAAVLGEGSRPADVRELAGLDAAAARAATDVLVVAEVLRPDGSLGFVHPLVRAAVVDELQPGARAELHRRAAEQLTASGAALDDIAGHLLAVEPSGDAAAVNVLLGAAQTATDRGAPEAAVAFLERAVSEPPPDQLRGITLLQLGGAAFRCGHPNTVAWLAEALDAAPDPLLWVLTWLTLTQASGIHDEHGHTELYLDNAPALDGELALPVAASKMINYGFFGRGEDGEWAGIDADLSETPSGATPFQRIWLAAAAFKATMDGDSAERVALLADRALANGQFLAEALDISLVPLVLCALGCTGEVERCLAECSVGVETSVRRGAPTPFEWFSGARAACNLFLGDIAEAEADLLASFGPHRDHVWPAGLPVQLGFLIRTLCERGELAKADEELRTRGLMDDDPPANLFGMWLLASRGQLHLAQGRARRALTDYQACASQLRQWGATNSAWIRWRSGAARCLQALGEQDQAASLAAEQVAAARKFGSALWIGEALRTQGVINGGDDGIALVREAIVMLEQTSLHLEHAHALCDLGVLLRHNRHPRDAREPLRRALDFASRHGARALADRATQQLAATGARPRRRAISGADSLTAAERRAASLAAQGKSNPEIAQSLFVTRKTVEKHLGNAFLKLQITSRAELAAALNAQG